MVLHEKKVKKAKGPGALSRELGTDSEVSLESGEDGPRADIPWCKHCLEGGRFPGCCIPVHEDCGGTRTYEPDPFSAQLVIVESFKRDGTKKVSRPRMLVNDDIREELRAFLDELRGLRVKKRRLPYRVGAYGL